MSARGELSLARGPTAEADMAAAPTPPATAAAVPATKLAVVTGASSGIGAAIARLLAVRGHATLLVARRTTELRVLAAQLTGYAPSAVCEADLADPIAARDAVESALRGMGPVEVLVNAAGAGRYCRFLDDGPADHDLLMRINYTGARELIRSTLPGMLDRGRGHVINIASISTKMSPWGHSSYTPAKAALVALTQSLAAEYSDRGVHFSYVNPGIVRTEFFESESLRRLWPRVKHHAIEPERVARRVVALLDRPRLELNVPAHYRVLDALRVLSVRLCHRVVVRGSRPHDTEPPAGS